jgi:predicted transposase YdaD
MDVPDTSEDVDLILRHVSRQFPQELARALLPPGTPVAAVAWPETQVTARQRRLDRALDITTAGGQRHCAHVEWQMEMEPDVPFRVFEYHTLLATALGSVRPSATVEPPIRSTVVLLSGSERPWPEEGEYRTSPPGEPFSGVTFRIDPVYQRTVAELEARGPMWAIFAPLAVDADPDGMKRVLARLRTEMPKREMEELAAALAVMADVDKRRRGLRRVIVPLLSEEIVMQNWIYKQGEQKGIEKGIEKGRVEGRAELLLDQLAAKFGRLPPKVRARVRKASLEELTAWGTRVLTATTLADVLDAPSTPPALR